MSGRNRPPGRPQNNAPRPPSPEELVKAANQQRMMAMAYAAQQRQAIATAVLSGIVAGLYTNPKAMEEGYGDRAVADALNFADKLQARLVEQAREQAARAIATEPSRADAAPAGDAPPAAAN